MHEIETILDVTSNYCEQVIVVVIVLENEMGFEDLDVHSKGAVIITI